MEDVETVRWPRCCTNTEHKKVVLDLHTLPLGRRAGRLQSSEKKAPATEQPELALKSRWHLK